MRNSIKYFVFIVFMITGISCYADGCTGFSGSWFGSVTNNGFQFNVVTNNYYSSATHKAMIVFNNTAKSKVGSWSMSGTCDNGYVDLTSNNGAELSGNINAASGLIKLQGHAGGSGGPLSLDINKQS